MAAKQGHDKLMVIHVVTAEHVKLKMLKPTQTKIQTEAFAFAGWPNSTPAVITYDKQS